MTKLLQCLRDELVRRDYAAPTIRSYIQIVEAFRQHTGTRLDRTTPAQLRRYHLFLLEERHGAISETLVFGAAREAWQNVCAPLRLEIRVECGNPARTSVPPRSAGFSS